MVDNQMEYWSKTIFDPLSVMDSILADVPDEYKSSPASVAEYLGIDVMYDIELLNGTSGTHGVCEGRPYIVVDASSPDEHQQCTILHEIIHLSLHWNSESPIGIGDAEVQAETLSLVLAQRMLDPERFIVYWKENPSAVATTLTLGLAGGLSLLAIGVTKGIDMWKSRKMRKHEDNAS